AGESIFGKAVLVRHEFPFSTGHVHRRVKYLESRRLGAGSFMIANNVPDIGPVTGGTGDGREIDVPSVGVSYEVGREVSNLALSRGSSVSIEVDAEWRTWDPENLILEIPGRTDKWIVLCAHYDGHRLAESAMDNGSGVAAVLEVARRIAP